jgi:hypothetical protein
MLGCATLLPSIQGSELGKGLELSALGGYPREEGSGITRAGESLARCCMADWRRAPCRCTGSRGRLFSRKDRIRLHRDLTWGCEAKPTYTAPLGKGGEGIAVEGITGLQLLHSTLDKIDKPGWRRALCDGACATDMAIDFLAELRAHLEGRHFGKKAVQKSLCQGYQLSG